MPWLLLLASIGAAVLVVHCSSSLFLPSVSFLIHRLRYLLCHRVVALVMATELFLLRCMAAPVPMPTPSPQPTPSPMPTPSPTRVPSLQLQSSSAATPTGLAFIIMGALVLALAATFAATNARWRARRYADAPCACCAPPSFPPPRRRRSPHTPPPPSPPPMAPGPDDAEEQRDEAIGAAAAEAAQLTPEQEAWLLELEEAKRLIEALPVIKSVELFFHDTDPNLNKVEVTLWCCWSSGRLKRAKVACDKSGEKPTHLEAMRRLYADIQKDHMLAGHQHDPRAVAKREELGVALGAPPGSTAFDRMAAAQAAARLAQRTAEADQQRVEQAMEAERRAAVAQEEAAQRRKEAEATAKRSKAAAEALSRPCVPPTKKQRTVAASASGSSTDAAAEPMGAEAAATTEEAADPERWESYSLLTFRSVVDGSSRIRATRSIRSLCSTPRPRTSFDRSPTTSTTRCQV